MFFFHLYKNNPMSWDSFLLLEWLQQNWITHTLPSQQEKISSLVPHKFLNKFKSKVGGVGWGSLVVIMIILCLPLTFTFYMLSTRFTYVPIWPLTPIQATLYSCFLFFHNGDKYEDLKIFCFFASWTLRRIKSRNFFKQ